MPCARLSACLLVCPALAVSCVASVGRRKGTYKFWVHNMFSKLFRREKNEKCPPIGSPLGRFGRYFVPKKLCFWATFWAGSGPWGGPKSPQKSPPKVFPGSGRNHQTYCVYVLFCPFLRSAHTGHSQTGHGDFRISPDFFRNLSDFYDFVKKKT